MNYLRSLGLAAVAALVMMALAGSASATVLTNGGKAMGFGDALAASVTSSQLLKTSTGTTIATCTNGEISETIVQAGGGALSVWGGVNTLTWGGCNTTVDTIWKGTLSIDSIGAGDGTVFSSGARITVNYLGVSCIFETKATDIGTLREGYPATLSVYGKIPVVSSFPCPAEAIWSGSYTITNPSGTLGVD